MKTIKTIALAFSVTFLFSCGGGGDDSPPASEENKAPEKVETLTYPTNNLLCIDNTLDFQWGASSDPNGDEITYTLEIATEGDFSDAETHSATTATTTVTLEKGKAYHWRVQAKDSKGLTSDYSSVYQFYTEGIGEINHLPFSPELIAPVNDSNTSDASIDLKWNASDVDDDTLTYDVYFDTVNPPLTKVGDNQSEKQKNVALSAATTYYWQVVVKDGNGGESIGQVWSFITN